MIDAIAVIAAIGTILGTVAAAGLARKWVWGYQLADMTKDRDFWRDAALRAMGNADKAINVVEKVSGG